MPAITKVHNKAIESETALKLEWNVFKVNRISVFDSEMNGNEFVVLQLLFHRICFESTIFSLNSFFTDCLKFFLFQFRSPKLKFLLYYFLLCFYFFVFSGICRDLNFNVSPSRNSVENAYIYELLFYFKCHSLISLFRPLWILLCKFSGNFAFENTGTRLEVNAAFVIRLVGGI